MKTKRQMQEREIICEAKEIDTGEERGRELLLLLIS